MSTPEGSAADRRERLKAVYLEARDCTRCALAAGRTQVVFGSGNADANLMFVGEAPGANEDRIGLPFVGQAGKLLERLLGEIGLERADVFIANVLKCRPPGNRDPRPEEIQACEEYLFRQVALIEPTVICTLGNFATKLLRGDSAGISRLHGQAEERTIGSRMVRLLPLYHPAAALYTPSMLETLRADFALIRGLLDIGPPEQPVESVAEGESAVAEDEFTGPAPELAGPAPEFAGADEGSAVAEQDSAQTEGWPATREDPVALQDGEDMLAAEQLGLF